MPASKRRPARGRGEEPVVARSLRKLLRGCTCCAYDEGDGQLYSHCDHCCRLLTTWVWANWPELHLRLVGEYRRVRITAEQPRGRK